MKSNMWLAVAIISFLWALYSVSMLPDSEFSISSYHHTKISNYEKQRDHNWGKYGITVEVENPNAK